MSGVLMSFVPATSSRDALALVAIAVVAVLAVFLRRVSSKEPGAGGGSPADGVAPPSEGSTVPAGTPLGDDDHDEDVLDESEDYEAAVSIEGVAFVPQPHGVLLLPLIAGGEVPDGLERALDSNFVPYTILNKLAFPGYSGGVPRRPPGTTLGAGDLTGARVVRGSADSGPWRLETLGRDGDFGFHPFGAEEAARAALDLLERKGVVLKTVDEHGTVPASPEDFEEARRRYEATEAELAVGDEDSRPGEGPWVSDRR